MLCALGAACCWPLFNSPAVGLNDGAFWPVSHAGPGSTKCWMEVGSPCPCMGMGAAHRPLPVGSPPAAWAAVVLAAHRWPGHDASAAPPLRARTSSARRTCTWEARRHCGNRRLWAGSRAPPPPLFGIEAAKALLSGPAGGPVQAGRLLEQRVAARPAAI
eukprot:scaffold16636_cov64-Phaeocystis_antarctica.AAC.3